MKPNEFKQLLNEALEPIKKTLKKHTEILGAHSKALESHSKTLVSVTKTLVSHSKTLKAQAATLEILKSSVLTIETTNAVYGDMYKINDDNSRKLEKRIGVLEDNAGIEAPPELTLLKVQ